MTFCQNWFAPNPPSINDLAFKKVKKWIEALPLFKQFDNENQIHSLKKTAQNIRDNFDDVIILGTGGSSLGAKALYAFKDEKAPTIHFMDNIDPHTFQELFNAIDLKKTKVVAISKSGSTSETLAQLLTCLERFELEGINDISNHFLIVTEKKESAFTNIAADFSIESIEHPNDIGGRFSVYSVTGLLPSLIAGIDVERFWEGAKEVIAEFTEQGKNHISVHSAVHQYQASLKGVNQTVLMPYIDRFKLLSDWFAQLWAESLGKKKGDGFVGTTPLKALGTVDQHSQLQLYLEGPRDKFFTLITYANHSKKDVIKHDKIPYLTGQSMGHLIEAEQKAIIETFKHHNLPLRVLEVEEVSEKSMGSLMMLFILETLLMAAQLDIDPFDQPAVEMGKILTKEYMMANKG